MEEQSQPAPGSSQSTATAARQNAEQENTTSRPQSSQVSPPASEQTVRTQTPEESKKELQEAIQGSNQLLVSATTVLTLFPDTFTVDRAKLTVTKRTFFRVAEVISMRIEDVLNVTATVGPFFGTVKVVSRVLNAEKPYTAGKFWREDAMRIKRVLQGYVIALQRNIDCSSLEIHKLAAMLDELGRDEHPGLQAG